MNLCIRSLRLIATVVIFGNIGSVCYALNARQTSLQAVKTDVKTLLDSKNEIASRATEDQKTVLSNLSNAVGGLDINHPLFAEEKDPRIIGVAEKYIERLIQIQTVLTNLKNLIQSMSDKDAQALIQKTITDNKFNNFDDIKKSAMDTAVRLEYQQFFSVPSVPKDKDSLVEQVKNACI